MEDAHTIILPPGAAAGDDLGLRHVFEFFAEAACVEWAEITIRSPQSKTELVFTTGVPSGSPMTYELQINDETEAILTLAGDAPPITETLNRLVEGIDRELHRRRLIAETGLLRGALDATSSAILLFGPSGNILFANGAADTLISRQTEDELTVDWNGSGPQPLFGLLCAQVARLQRDPGQQPWRDRLEISDGSQLTSQLFVVPIESEGLDHVVMAVLREIEQPRDDHIDEFASLYQLSPRESEVLRLLVQGFDTAGLAERLGISPHTVRDHLKNVFRKTSNRSRSELLSALTGVGGHTR